MRRFLKTGILFLVIGLVLGLWMMVDRELRGRISGPYAVSAHTHAILVGFVMMMILGVALWLFPRPSKEDTRYTPRAAEGAYWLVTVGTAARVIGELLRPSVQERWMGVAIVASGVSQVAGIVLFFYTMWARIRPAGSHAREAQGERF